MDYDELEKACVDAVSREKMLEHIHWIDREAPYRICGGGQDRKAAEYIHSIMESYGLESEITEFETFNSFPATGKLRVVAPEERELDCLACLHIDATPSGGFEAELVYVGPGRESDYEGKDVRGKIVLAEVSYAPGTPEKARIAHVHGAAGMILMNWGPADQPHLPWRGLKSLWGNPTPEMWKQLPALYAVTITRLDGEYLHQLCANGPVRVHMETTSIRSWDVVPQPVATLHAPDTSPEAQQFIIVSGHLDSWDPGITDNASGNAVMLEAARILSQHRDKLRRSVTFCFWNGHEIAESSGSTYYLDSEWDRVNRDAVAYLTIDGTGIKHATHFVANSAPELSLFHGPIEERVLGERGKREGVQRFGDQSFFGVGVPSLTGHHSLPDELVEEWHGANLGWWNHTPLENMDFFDEDLFYKEARLWIAYIVRLATMPVLPQRFTPYASEFATNLALIAAGGEDPVGVSELAARAEQLAEACRWLDETAEALTERWERESAGEDLERETQRLNRALMRMSRHLTAVTSTVSGRYGQDSYGLSTLYEPVPMLAPLQDFRAQPEDSLERKLLITKLMRVRNEISDALFAAYDEIDLLKDTLVPNAK